MYDDFSFDLIVHVDEKVFVFNDLVRFNFDGVVSKVFYVFTVYSAVNCYQQHHIFVRPEEKVYFEVKAL